MQPFPDLEWQNQNMIQKRYEGFLKTPFLWKNGSLCNLNAFDIISQTTKINIAINEKLRLGKYVERFVSFELAKQTNINILAENLQIQDNKITLGELDCLLLQDNKPIHLEIIYKFYLYDPAVGANEMEHFIGPNRTDSLIEKLNKLKDKQLPLLYSDTCKTYLHALNLKPENMLQQVYFKAQLFVPFSNQDIELKKLNPNCIVGFYINKYDLDAFVDCKFYLPKKKDWLIEPNTNVKWLNFEAFKKVTMDHFEQKFSTLFWIKCKNGELKKAFFVWW